PQGTTSPDGTTIPPTQGTAPNDVFRRPTRPQTPPTPNPPPPNPNQPQPQPATIQLGPGETKVWNNIGMDLDELTVPELSFHFNPRAMDVTDISFGPALRIDPTSMPAIAIDRTAGTIRVKPTNGKPLQFVSGGVVLAIRVHGGLTGDTFLVIDNPDVRNAGGVAVVAAVTGGKARVQ